MGDRLRIILCALGVLALRGFAQTPGRAEILKVDPPENESTLNGRDYVSVGLWYEADRDVLIWVRPYFNHRSLNVGISHPSPTYPAGSGEAFGWFQIPQKATEVDEIHVEVVDAHHNKVLFTVSKPVQFHFTGVSAEARGRAEWALAMNAQQQQGFDNANRAYESQTPGAGDDLLFLGFGALVILVLVVVFVYPVYALWKWRDVWGLALMAPWLVMAYVAGRIVVDTTIDPTSHNLAPFEVLIWGGPCFAFIAFVSMGRYAVRRTHRHRVASR